MGTSTVICLTISFVAIVLSIICLIASIIAIIELRSFMKSTHKVEWMPLESSPVTKEPLNSDILEEFDL